MTCDFFYLNSHLTFTTACSCRSILKVASHRVHFSLRIPVATAGAASGQVVQYFAGPVDL